MIKVQFSKKDPFVEAADMLVMFATGDNWLATPASKKLDQATGGLLSRRARQVSFGADQGEIMDVTPPGKAPFASLRIVGLGPSMPTEAPDHLKLVGDTVRWLKNQRYVKKVSVLLPVQHSRRFLHNAALAAHLGAYDFAKKQGQTPTALKSVVFFAPRSAGELSGAAVVKHADAVARGVLLARTLVNEPADTCTPAMLAVTAKKIGEAPGMTATVWEKPRIKKEGMNLFLAVARGSDQPPKFIMLEWAPRGTAKQNPVVIVGKGLTFDSGGMNLKTAEGMLKMKGDMAGSAAAIGFMKTVSLLKPKQRIIMLVAACENMANGSAYKPGDIITGRSGLSVEIHNTDAEGRLTLADALSYAADLNPACIVDLATLTGAIVVALGPETTGLFCNDNSLAAELLNAAGAAGEDMWRMPLNPRLMKLITPPAADLKNTGGRWGGSITAALFLEAFVKKVPWAHLDIAGPADAARADGHLSFGGTGVGVATLAQWLIPPEADNG